MPYNFFEPETVSAPVYLLRYILHDWPDHVSVKILQNLIKAMTPGSRILIVDVLLVWTEKISLIKAKAQRYFSLVFCGPLTWYNVTLIILIICLVVDRTKRVC